MLKLCPIGREVTVPLYPEAKPGTAAGDLRIKVRLVNRPTFRRWAYEHERILAENRARVRDLRKTISAEDSPDLHVDEVDLGEGRRVPFVYRTLELREALDALMRSVIEAAVLELFGLEVEGEPPESYRDPKRIAEMLEHAELLEAAWVAVLGAQTPEKQEVFSSGS